VSKAAEVRDATAKAMESDLKRIGLSNEQDLLDLERKYKAEERRLKEGVVLPLSWSHLMAVSAVSCSIFDCFIV
jgi:hypothetical protein